MKTHILLGAMAFAILTFSSCSDADSLDQVERVSPEIIKLIADQGFSTDGVLRIAEGYLVEGDIIMTEEQLRSQPLHVRVPSEEQYHTFNLVSAMPRTITVGFDRKVDQSIVDATLAAMERYNDRGLFITFAQAGGAANAGPPGGGNGNGNGNGNGGGGGGGTSPDILISKAPRNAQYLASAGFPTSTGDPHNSIKVNQAFLLNNGWGTATITSIMAHEIGHCIGFRHTDWYERQISCGGSPGQFEGQENSGVGAVHIDGTPTQFQNIDGNSYMLSCIGNGIDRPFTNDDITALECLYASGIPCTN